MCSPQRNFLNVFFFSDSLDEILRYISIDQIDWDIRDIKFDLQFYVMESMKIRNTHVDIIIDYMCVSDFSNVMLHDT